MSKGDQSFVSEEHESNISTGDQNSDSRDQESDSSLEDQSSGSRDQESDSSIEDQSSGSGYYESNSSTGNQRSDSEDHESNLSTGRQNSGSEDYESNSKALIPFKPKNVIEQEACSLFSSIQLPSNMHSHRNDEKEEVKKNKTDVSSPMMDGFDGKFKDKLEAICRGLEKPYSGYNEELPKHPAYHPSFANVERICEEIFAGASQLFANSDYHDGYTESLHAKIKESRSIVYPPATKVGFIGDSGVGKVS